MKRRRWAHTTAWKEEGEHNPLSMKRLGDCIPQNKGKRITTYHSVKRTELSTFHIMSMRSEHIPQNEEKGVRAYQHITQHEHKRNQYIPQHEKKKRSKLKKYHTMKRGS